MGSLKESFEGLRDMFLGMPLPTRVISAALALLVGIGLWMVATGTTSSPALERIYPNERLSDAEITRVLNAFATSSLNDWDLRNNYIYIPTASRDQYYQAVQAANIMIGDSETFQKRAQDDSSPFLSSNAFDQKMAHGKELDTERKIMALRGIKLAYFEHDARKEAFGSLTQSASVVVTPDGNESLSPTMISAIKQIVKGSYAGMGLEDIEVIDINARGAGSLLKENPLLAQKIEWERDYTSKARELLAGMGPDLKIAATVELDPTMNSETFGRKIDAQPTTLSEQNGSITTESSRPITGGTVGLAANQIQGTANQPRALDPTQVQTTKSTQKNEAIQKVAGEQYEMSSQAPLQPKRVKFSVGIPDTYYTKRWQLEYLETNPDADITAIPALAADKKLQLTKETEDSVRDALNNLLLSGVAGEDRMPNIEVWEYKSIPYNPPATASTTSEALAWLARSWQTLAMFGVAIVALLIARSVGKATSKPSESFEEGFGLEIPKPPEELMSPADDDDDGPKLTITGQHLKEDLCELVGTSPEAAANVLRKWLDNDAA